MELPLGQELPDLDGLASLFAESPGAKPADPYESMQYTDMNLYTLVPDAYTSGTYLNISSPLCSAFQWKVPGSMQQ